MSGDNDAFGMLFARHRERLWAVAVRTLGDPDDAGDALQDAMISAFRRAGSFRGDSAVTTWLHRIVVNACLDLLRRRAARPATSGLADEAMDALALTSRGKSRCSRGRARLLPRLAHLRGSPAAAQAASIAPIPPAGPAARNRSAAGDVSPAEGGGESR